MGSSMPIYRQIMVRAIKERMRWKSEYETAKSRAGPLTNPAHPPDPTPILVGAVPVKGERSESRSDTKCP